MRRLLPVLVVASLLIVACSATPAPAPTQPPAKPTAAAPASGPTAAPTAAPAAKPTDVPAKKVEYPQKGKVLTIIAPWAAGGSASLGARALGAALEPILGITVENVEKPGAGSQVGTTELAAAKPDGYTLGYITMPTVQTLYLNPERQATFSRSSFQPVSGHNVDRGIIVVRTDSPYKSIEDLVNAAKANPGKVTAVDTGILGGPHLAIVQLQRLTGVKFAVVHVEGGSQNATTLLGGHADVSFGFAGDMARYVLSGQFRVLGVMDTSIGKLLPPGTRTMESQGYKGFNFPAYRTVVAPAGVPKEIVQVIAGAVKKATEDPAHVKKMQDAGLEVEFMDTERFTAEWADYEQRLKPLVEEALAEAKK